MSVCDCAIDAQTKAERKTLIVVLTINAIMFFVEFSAGIISESTGLTADSLDMLADASVYGISLFAIGRHMAVKQRAALLSGIVQISLGLFVMVEVIRRTFVGSEPVSEIIVVAAAVALVANSACIVLLAKHRHGEVHLRASWIFTTNDVIVNTGVILSGILIWITDSRYPDLIVGLIVSALVIKGGLKIVRETRSNP